MKKFFAYLFMPGIYLAAIASVIVGFCLKIQWTYYFIPLAAAVGALFGGAYFRDLIKRQSQTTKTRLAFLF